MRTTMSALTAIAVMAALGLAGCSSGTTSPTADVSSTGAPAPSTVASATPAAGVDGAVKDLPWSQVGPGWILAESSPASSQTAGTTLYLVDPAGKRYAVTTFAPGQDVQLADWSGDGSHALLAPAFVTPTSAISVDLHTGAQTTVPVAGFPRYTRPDGAALLVSTSYNGNRPGTLKRVDLEGNSQLTYRTDDLDGAGEFSGNYAQSLTGRNSCSPPQTWATTSCRGPTTASS